MGPSLGDKFFAWLQSLWQYAAARPPLSTVLGLIARFQGWQSQLVQDVTQDLVDGLGAGNDPYALAFSWALSKISGKRPSEHANKSITEISAMMDNPSLYFVDKINEVSASPEIRQAVGSLTQLVQSQLVAPLKGVANDIGQDPLQAVVSVIASLAVAKAAMHSVGIGAEILSLGQIQTVDDAMTALSAMFPIEEITSLALRPLIETAIVPASERFYNTQFRNARLPISDLAILTHFGVVSDGKFRQEAREEGFREEDIDLFAELQRARIQPGDAIRAREVGQIDDTRLIQTLTQFRYSPDDAQFIAELASRERHQAWSERLFSIALRQFTNYRIDSAKLADIGRAAGFSQERIDAEVAVASATASAEIQDLSVSEIEAAFKSNIISEQEAATYLQQIHVDPSGIPILLETWKATLKAGGTRLNAARLTEAFHAGVIDSAQMLKKLEDLGWNPPDARLLVQIAEYQRPSQPREINEAMIATAYADKVLSRNEAIQKLEDLGLIKADAELVLQVKTLLPAQKSKSLTAAEIAKCYELKVLSENDVLNRFVQMGYSEDDAALLFVALTTKKPSPTKTKPPKGK